MTDLLAIDPGLTHPGAALIRDGVLLRAERIPTQKEWMKLEILERCYLIARAVVDWGLKLDMVPTHLVVEWPQWYSETKSGGIDPNDLAGLCGIAGAALGILNTQRFVMARSPMIGAKSPKPRQVWGDLPKFTTGDPWRSPRGHRLAARLTAEERQRVSKHHDALDAAGLALWGVGRWQDRRRVFPGAV